jgi:hypothetical protein
MNNYFIIILRASRLPLLFIFQRQLLVITLTLTNMCFLITSKIFNCVQSTTFGISRCLTLSSCLLLQSKCQAFLLHNTCI